MAMGLVQLRYFEAVARTRNFTRAAEQVHVAQPSLSTQIKALEADLGVALFDRARGNISLTPAGEVLLPLARRILEDVEHARIQVQELAGLARGRLRIGATPSLASALLPALVRSFAEDHPGVDLHLDEGGSRDLVRRLAEGRLDLALIVLPLHTGDPSLLTVPLLEEELVVATAPGHHDDITSMTIRELASERLVMFRSGYDLRDTTLAACRAAGVRPAFAIEGGEMGTVLRLVAAGVGIAVVPSMVLDTQPTLRRVRLGPPSLSRSIALARRRDVEPSAAARELIRRLEAHLDVAAAEGTLPSGVARVRSIGAPSR